MSFARDTALTSLATQLWEHAEDPLQLLFLRTFNYCEHYLHVDMGNAPDLCWHCFIQLSDPGSDRFITHGLIVLPLPILTTLNPYIGGGAFGDLLFGRNKIR